MHPTFVDRAGVSVKDYIQYVSGRVSDLETSLEGYHIPSTDMLTSRVLATKIKPSKILPYVDKLVKDHLWIPAPGKYHTEFNWSNQKDLHKKGHFSKMARTTFTEGIFKDKRIKEWPGPNSYKAPRGDFEGFSKKAINPKGSDKTCAFIGEA